MVLVAAANVRLDHFPSFSLFPYHSKMNSGNLLCVLKMEYNVEASSTPSSNTDTQPLTLPLDLDIPIDKQENQWLELCVEILVGKIHKYHDMAPSASPSSDFIKQKIEEAEKEIALERGK